MNTGAYHASKWALEGISQSLAQEVAGFGIKVTLVEPGGYSTDWAGPSAKHATALPAYDELHEAAAAARAKRYNPGEPTATRAAILQLVDSENPPLRMFLGAAPLAIASADYESPPGHVARVAARGRRRSGRHEVTLLRARPSPARPAQVPGRQLRGCRLVIALQGTAYFTPSIATARCRGPRRVGFCRYGGGSSTSRGFTSRRAASASATCASCRASAAPKQ